MVKVEDEYSSDVEILDHTVSKAESAGVKQSSGPITGKRERDSSSFAHLRSHFVGMGFLPRLVDKVIEEHGGDDADLLLEALLTYTALQKLNSDTMESMEILSSNVEELDSTCALTTPVKQATEDLEESAELGTDKKSSLLAMNFSLNEVHTAIKSLGEGATIAALIDFIVSSQVAGNSKEKEIQGSNKCQDHKDKAASVETSYGSTEKMVCLREMGFTEDEIANAIDNFGSDVPIWELADSIFANRIAYAVIKEEKEDNENASASSCIVSDSGDMGRIKRPKSTPVNEKSASNRDKKARFAKGETTCPAKGSPCNALNRSTAPRTPEVEMLASKSVRELLSRPPYVFYGNVVDVSQDIWTKLSQFLYGIEPEYTNAQLFSALSRKEGYIHNLSKEERVHILPRAPLTIAAALPHTRKWWPSWDTRKHINCISSGSTGVARLCERLGKMMMDSQGMLSKEQQMDILHQCETQNLIWTGRNKLSPIDPDQVEHILGYPTKHTEIWGMKSADRLKALRYSFQTDSLGYHLSALKSMYPEGVRMLSVYSGIGGAEVALHRLGVHLKCVISVESAEGNREILKRWWQNSGQVGKLVQVGGIEKLTTSKLDSIIKQFGGFDLVVGSNACAQFSETPEREGSAGVDLTLFFEFVRVFQRVRSLMNSC